MEKFRIGDDLSVFWAIQDKDDSPFPLEGKDVRLFVTHPRGRIEVTDEIEIQDNVICWEFKGVSQKYLGTYKLTAEIRTNPSTRVVRKDIQEAFALVSESVYEDSEGTPPLVNENGTIYLSSVLDVYRIMPVIPQIGPNGNWWIDGEDTGHPSFGGNANIRIDKEMSPDSTNPVQNKVVKAYVDLHPMYEILEELEEVPDFGDTIIVLDDFMSDTSENGVKNKVVKKYVDQQDNALLVKHNDLSRRVINEYATRAWINSQAFAHKTDIEDIQEQIEDIADKEIVLDDSMSDTSENGVQNKVIKKYVDQKHGELVHLKDMFFWDENRSIIGTRFPLYSEKSITAGGKNENTGEGGGGQGGLDIAQLEEYLLDNGYVTKTWIEENVRIDLDSSMSDTSDNGVKNKVIKKYVDQHGENIKKYVDEQDKELLGKIEELSHLKDMFYWDEDGAIGTTHPFFSESSITAGGANENSGGGYAGIDIATLEEYLMENKYATQSWVKLQQYATESWVQLQQFATESWVKGRGYITNAAFMNAINRINSKIQELNKLLEWFEFDSATGMVKVNHGLYSVGAITAGQKEEE